MKNRGLFSRIFYAAMRGVFFRIPISYVLMNRVNRAYLRKTFSSVNPQTIRDFWLSFDFVSLALDSYIHYGDKADGGYFLVGPIDANHDLISVGIGDNYSFDEALSSKVNHVYMFDHTIEIPPSIPKNATFYSYGLGSISGASVLSFRDLIKKSRDGSNKIVKIDIEGAEWDVFDSLNSNDFSDVDQLIVEFHGLLEILRNSAEYSQALRVLALIKEHFWTVNINVNNWGNCQIIHGSIFPDVIEVTFLKRRLDVSHQNKVISELGYPNNPNESKVFLQGLHQVLR
jgi:hypothetical protein